MKKKIWFLMVSFIGFLSLMVPVTSVTADDVGGVVQTKGEVGFYEETSSSTTTSQSSTPMKVTKPKGKFPSTGELIKKSMMVSGALILLLLLFVLLNKQRKKE
ncbi:LPXTG cell wall anchor domain-containing protein [Enterococcus sp. LJL99]